MTVKELIYYETIEDLKQLPDGSVIHAGDAKIHWFGGITFEMDYIKQPDGLIERSWWDGQPRDTFFFWSQLKSELEDNHWKFYTVDGNK